MARTRPLTRRTFVRRTAAGAAAGVGMACLVVGRTQGAERVDGSTEREEYVDKETGARVIRLTNNAEYNDLHAYYDMSPWSPDGSKIVFSSAPAVKDGHPPNAQIYMMDADGANIRKLADSPGISTVEDSNRRPMWAADGESVYFFTYDVRRMKNETLLRRVFLERRKPSVRDVVGQPGKVRSIGDFWLWKASETTGRLLSTDPSGLYSYAPDGSDKQQLASMEQVKAGSPTRDKSPPHRSLDHAKWNADGTKCMVVLRGEGVKELHVVNADGSDLHFCSQFGKHPSWHPNEDQILCTMSDGIYVVDADGKGKRRIARGLNRGHPSYSPDGSLIATDSFRGVGDVYLIDPRTGEWRKLCSAPIVNQYRPVTGSCHQHPVWSRDGKSIIFDCNRSGTAQIYQVFVG